MDDLAAFSDPSFTTSSWVNSALTRMPEGEPLEAYLASLAMKLHIISQDYTDQLETGMVDAVATMPRVLSEVARVEDILKSVDSEMSELAGRLRTFDQRNVHGVLELSRLDTLKSNMERCKGGLEEHARWGQLVREAKAFLQGGGRLADSADRVATMRRSLIALANMPGHDERRATSVQLSDALLAAVRPRALQEMASSTLNLPAVQEYVYVYAQLDRHAELETEYINTRPAALQATWLDYSPMETTHASFLDFFRQFMSQLEALLTLEGKNVRFLFGESGSAGKGASAAVFTVVSRMLVSTLDATFKLNLHERIRETMSPADARAVYDAVNGFASRCVPDILALAKDKDEGDAKDASSAALAATDAMTLLTALYAPMAENLDVLCYAEGVLLRTALADAIASVQFGTDAEDPLACGAESVDASSFEDATGLGLSAADMDDDNGNSRNNGASKSPVYACTAFAWQLARAAGQIEEPCIKSLQRSCSLMGGLHTHQAIDSAAKAIAVFATQLTHKLDELRVNCGLPSALPSKGQSGGGVFSSESSARGYVSNEGGRGSASKAAAEAWVRHLESQGLHIMSRQLIPPVLRALQATGRLGVAVRRVEEQARECTRRAQSKLFPSGADGDMQEAVAELAAALAISAVPHIDGGSEKQASDVGAAYARYTVRQRRHESLQKYLSAAEKASLQPLLVPVPPLIAALQTNAGALFFDVCTAEPERTLHGYAEADEVWADESDYGVPEEGEHLFIGDNVLPQSVITQCGEHLLSLVQELELFAASDALADLDVLHGQAAAHVVRSTGWGSAMRNASSRTSEAKISVEAIEQLCHRPSAVASIKAAEQDMFSSIISDLTDSIGVETDGVEQKVQSRPRAGSTLDETTERRMEAVAIQFVNEWLQAMCDAVTGLVLTQISCIPVLTHRGRAQLAVDIDYLSNVIDAMGLKAHPLLAHTTTLLNRNPLELLAEVSKHPARGAAGMALQWLDMCIARACGPQPLPNTQHSAAKSTHHHYRQEQHQSVAL